MRTAKPVIHGKARLEITPETPIPLWEGEKMDSSMAVEVLLWLESRQDSAMIRGDDGVEIDQMF